ncbi:MAG TPA: hypothetical protein VGR19_12910 [Allosphingosinicella sp.]|nr:hypothetical protein [Allosphingosinicella sp.]
MTQHNHVFLEVAGGDAGRHYARLGSVLDLVHQIAGSRPRARGRALDETARLIGAYEAAPPIARRRFDTLASEASVWAAAGVDALASAADPARQPKPAAGRLADELDEAMAEMRRLLGA